jgi:hypothetical protein
MKALKNLSWLAALAGASLLLCAGCARFNSTVTERVGPDGKTVERVTVVKAGTLLDSKSELTKLNSGQTDKSQKVSIGSLNQESSGSNAISFAESVVGAAVRAAVKP